MIGFMRESDTKHVVRNPEGRYFLLATKQSYSFNGNLYCGMIEIDPLTANILTVWATEGETLFTDLDGIHGPLYKVNSDESCKWYETKQDEAKKAKSAKALADKESALASARQPEVGR